MLIRLFALTSALVGGAPLVYFALFLLNIGPVGVDRPLAEHGTVAGNVLLLLLFCVSHSVLARPYVKQALFGKLNQRMSRSAYNLVAGITLGLLMYVWEPLPSVIWSVGSPLARAVIYAVFVFGWIVSLLAVLSIDPFHLFGLRQAFSAYPAEPPFSERGPYRVVRHPIQVGLILIFWSTPDMSVGHLLLALLLTAYSVLATLALEEQDLRSALGIAYVDYARRVPALVPRLFRHRR